MTFHAHCRSHKSVLARAKYLSVEQWPLILIVLLVLEVLARNELVRIDPDRSVLVVRHCSLGISSSLNTLAHRLREAIGLDFPD